MNDTNSTTDTATTTTTTTTGIDLDKHGDIFKNVSSSCSSDKYMSDIPDVERYVETAVLVIISLVSSVANGSMWVVVLSTKSLRQQTSMLLLLSLSLADVLVSCVSMPVTAVTVAMSRWMFGARTCTAMGFISMLSLVCSVMSLGLISVNRYVKICQPRYYSRLFTLPRICVMSAGVWFLSALLSSPPLFGWCRYDYLPNQSFCFCDWPTSVSYTFFMVAACFCGPLFMMSVCNLRILQTFRKSQKVLQSHRNTTSSSIFTSSVRDTQTSSTPMGHSSTNGEHEQDASCSHSYSFHKGNSATPSEKPPLTVLREDSAAEAGSDDDEMMCLESKAINSSTCTNDGPKATTQVTSISITQRLNLSSVGKALSRSQSKAKRQKLKEKQRAEEFQLALSLMLALAVFVISWLPFCVTMFMSVFAAHYSSRPANMSTLLLGYSNSCMNPIIYGVRNTRVKEGYHSVWRKMTSGCQRLVGRTKGLPRQRRASIPIGHCSD